MRVKIEVDSRLVVDVRQLPADALKALQDLCSHSNPQHAKLKALGYSTHAEPRLIKTWRGGPGKVMLPRGVLSKVRECLAEHGLEPDLYDCRTDPNPIPMPKHRVQLYDYQHAAAEAAIAGENCLIRAPTGCITGDAMISINRAGKGWTLPLKQLVKMQNGGVASGKRWDRSIPTMVRGRAADGTVRLIRLRDAYESGVKPVFELRLEDGRSIRATSDHRIYTARGWVRLGELTLADRVLAEESKRPIKRGCARRPQYLVRRAKYHPFASRRNVGRSSGTTVPLHRLVFEAAANGMTTERFIAAINAAPHPELTYFDPKMWVVHHRDENSKNNRIDNLCLLTHTEHRAEHRGLAIANLGCRTVPVAIAAITKCGEEPTFDLGLDAPHNFIANGLVVHNSGKTTIAMALIGRVRVPSLVVVWNTTLLKQWEERACKEFGLRPSELGIIQAGKVRLRPITLAMQQSMIRLGDDDRRAICSYFGAVVFDEVHRAAAKTFTEVIDWLPARYRFGMSADEQRKDRKEFLIYDMFGRVAFEVSQQVLQQRNFVLDVELRVHPTGAALDWYRDDQVAYDRLIAALECDDERTGMAAQIAADEVRAGHQTIVFSQRREHCARLAAALVERGLQPGMMLGGPESQAELQRTLAGLKSGTLRVAVGTIQAVGTGIDLPAISRGVLTTPISSNRQLLGQVRGRLCRTAPGKKDAVLHYLFDERAFGPSALRNLDRWNATCSVQNGSERVSVGDYLEAARPAPTFQEFLQGE